MSKYRKSMKDALREVRGIIKEDATSSYPPKQINKKKHDAYKDPKRGEHEILKKETSDPSVDDIAKGLKLDKKLVKKIMGEVFNYDEKVLDENVSQQIKTLKTIMAPMRGAKISIDGANKLMKIMDKFDKKEDLIALFKADIPFVSQSAAARLISKFRMSGAEVNKLREEVELKELFGISSTAYHRSNTMKFLDKMGIKHETSGRNGLIIKGVPKDKQQDLLNKIKKEVGMYNTATKEEVELDEMYTYTVVHVKHDKEVVKANSSYEAAKKYAQMKGLKSTAGVDAHLMEEVELDEKRIVLRPPINLIAKGEKPVKVKLDSKEYEMFMKKGYTRNEELDTDDKSVVKKVADKLAKASKAHAGQSKELKKAMTEKSHFTSAQIKQAYGIANDPRYKQGNMSGAVKTIEKIAKGLSKHPDVQKVLQRTQEEVELALAVESLFINEDKARTEKAFNDMIKDGGIDRKDYEKSKQMYKSGDLKGLRKHIYKLDTAPLEAIMMTIRQNDPKAFKTMYPKAKGGEYFSSISYQHRNEDVEHKGAKDLVEKIKGLQKKAEKSGMPYGILKKVYDRGMAAWKGGHRPGAKQQQWAFARVNSFITKSSGTWGGADKDLAAKVRSSK